MSLGLSGEDPPCRESRSSCVAGSQPGDENESLGGLVTDGCVGGEDGVNGEANGLSGECWRRCVGEGTGAFMGEVRRSDSCGDRSFMSSFMGDSDGDAAGG